MNLTGTEKAKHAYNLADDRNCLEVTVPSHMLWMASQATVSEGYILRADIVDYLNRAAIAPLARFADDPKRVSRLAKRTDEIARQALFELSPDKSVHAFYVTAMFQLLLVTEQLHPDPTCVAVSTAAVIMEDIRMEGGAADYTFRESLLLNEAKRLLDACRDRGLYRAQMQLIAEGAAPADQPLSN